MVTRIKTLSPDTVLYVNQMIPIIVNIGGDISTAKEHRIYYKKPDGTEGYWIATIHIAVEGLIKYNTQSTDIDMSGTWIFQGWEKDGSDNINLGRAVKVKVYNEFKVPV